LKLKEADEPAFHTIQLESVGRLYTKFLYLENGEITIVIDKDSIQKSKVSELVTTSM
jgi:hypothetical protein